MCNHYRNDIRKANLEVDIYGFREFSETRIRFDNHPVDIYPDRPAMVGRLNEGSLEFVEMRWGFAPPPGEKKLRNNTRRLHLPFWKPWLGPAHRCLVPFTSFAEWIEGPDGKSVETWFAPRHGGIGFIAGIWQPWHGTRGTKAEPVTGDHLLFSFLTSNPNQLVGRVHDRMPAILADRAAQEAWLTAPQEKVKEFQQPAPEDFLEMLEASPGGSPAKPRLL